MHTELLLNEKVFLNRSIYEEAERHYSLKNAACDAACEAKHSVSKAAGQCKSDLATLKVSDLVDRLEKMEVENKSLRTLVADLEKRLSAVDGQKSSSTTTTASKSRTTSTTEASKPAAAAAKTETKAPKAEKKDEDFDLFDDDEEEDDEEKARITAERIAAYSAKKGNKPALIAKSCVTLDIKPWDDETDMAEMERLVRTIEIDGLVWNAKFKLAPVAFGVKKLVASCIIEDDKVSTNDLEEKITEFEDLVQSVDIAAFNKL